MESFDNNFPRNQVNAIQGEVHVNDPNSNDVHHSWPTQSKVPSPLIKEASEVEKISGFSSIVGGFHKNLYRIKYF